MVGVATYATGQGGWRQEILYILFIHVEKKLKKHGLTG